MNIGEEEKSCYRILISIENLVKVARNTGPFGSASIEALSLDQIMKSSTEQSDNISTITRLLSRDAPIERVVSVILEDKCDKSKRIFVEEYVLSMSRIADGEMDFEYICMPILQKPETLKSYLKDWNNITLMSLYYLLQSTVISIYHLHPNSIEENEIASEIRIRYNLIIETNYRKMEERKAPLDIKNHKDSPFNKLEALIHINQDFKSLKINVAISAIKDVRGIIGDWKPKPAEVDHRTSGPARNRGRFFSDENAEYAMINHRIMKQVSAHHKFSADLNSAKNTNNSMESSSSFKSTNKPFKMQDAIADGRSRKNSDRRNSCMEEIRDGNNNNGGGRIVMNLEREYTLQDLSYTINENNGSTNAEDNDEKSESGLQKRQRSGLASIGSQLDNKVYMDQPYFEQDEDDMLGEILNSLECARMSLKVMEFPGQVSKKEEPSRGTAFKSTRLLINLSPQSGKDITEYESIERWISDLS